MEIAYYPGCTLKTTGINFEKTALALLALFDIQAVELSDWYCCGVMYSQAADNLMHQLAPLRTLLKAKETGSDRLLTLCSMCYNTLKQSQLFFQQDRGKREKIKAFLGEDVDFEGDEVEVIHLFTLLAGLGDAIRTKIHKPLQNLQVAPYYGCVLTKPKEIAIVEQTENPMIMEQILEAAGLTPVYFPFKTDCCASFQVVHRREIVKARTRKIVASAVQNGADCIVLSCPLCRYNLDAVQAEIKHEDAQFITIPVLYFTQLLAFACGLDPALNDFTLHHIDPRPLLHEKGVL